MRARSTNSWYEIEIASGSLGNLAVLTNFWWRPELCCFPCCCCCNRKSVLWWPEDDNSWEGDTSRLNPGSPLLGHPLLNHLLLTLSHLSQAIKLPISSCTGHIKFQISSLIFQTGGWPMSSHDLPKWCQGECQMSTIGRLEWNYMKYM